MIAFLIVPDYCEGLWTIVGDQVKYCVTSSSDGYSAQLRPYSSYFTELMVGVHHLL